MTPDEAKEQTYHLLDLITGPFAASIYLTHPNDLGADLTSHIDEKFGEIKIPVEWDAWRQWSREYDDSWKVLVQTSNEITASYGTEPGHSNKYDSASNNRDLPEDLARLLFDAKSLSLPRHPHIIPPPASAYSTPGISSTGMSPKKYHEVSRMTAYLLDLLESLSKQYGTEVQHVVDIGAGQGYLSRSLCNARNLHVLALDSSLHQTEGCARRSQQSKSEGTLTFQTLWLGQGPNFESHPGGQGSDSQKDAEFEYTIDEWISGLNAVGENIVTDEAPKQPTPVVFVALHACGSLTPSILKKVLDHQHNSIADDQSWFVASAVVVGCCYNLMTRDDFPLSQTVKNQIEQRFHTFDLSTNHLQLAAQVPSQWFKSPDAESATELAMKKILFRALITPCLFLPGDKAPDSSKTPQKLGKLSGKAYENFEAYLDGAGQKLGIDLLNSYMKTTTHDPTVLESTPLSRHIKTLHALRCLLGPPVESLIILDRYLWLQEELDRDLLLDTRLVNIFDQKTGSGRNIGIALIPCSSF